ncbi:EAL domain-containing protein [Catenovulum sp. 2E275]|uniref:bifunctional diguanylate cyclase/phosphodiesterase n=1 Tax=Catenovulum sp. 2E275 TaxID=2980497 RepID=UPI0021D252CA|nr:EAL domain-containing protein [Catenovulum sp. 2E275]MCU4677226.1 EAL domain-containing protein [Catenovulum sp. 2E275]
MSLKSLHYNIFKLVGGLLCFSSLSILFAIWIATTNHARTQVNGDLQVGERIFKQVLASRELQLFNSADVLTSDFGFKQAVATQDEATILSVLDNHGRRIKADLMGVMLLSGELIATGLADKASQETEQLLSLSTQALQQGGHSEIIQLGDNAYQIMLLTVDAPNPIAVAIIGFELDKSFIHELKEITKLDITIVKDQHLPAILISSLTSEQLPHVLNRVGKELDLVRLPFTYKNMYASKQFLLSTDNQSVWVILSEDLNPLFSEFNFLQFKIFVIVLMSLFLALFLGVLFAKNLTHPLTQLAQMAKRIAKGDYYNSIETKVNSQEMSNLALAFSAMQQNIKEREVEIQYQANHDLLTGLYNRYQIAHIIRQALDKAESFQVIGINIIDFRSINDTFGYQNGDICLSLLAERIMALGGSAARLNAGELLWIPEKLLTEQEILTCRKELEQTFIIDDLTLNLKLAIAVIQAPQDAQNEASLFRRLNITAEKSQSQAHFYQQYEPELEKIYLKKLAVLGELKNMLDTEQNELAMFYQPKLNTSNNKIEKAEALIRWNSQKLGFVSPDFFIPIAEQAGIIVRLTEWIIHRVVQDIARWQAEGVNVQVAINLSVHDVADETLLPKIMNCLNTYNVGRHALSFELTESDLMKDPVKAIEHLKAIRDCGFGLAIDDFGTGYSSLAYLKDMPVTELKVDKSFVLHLMNSEDDQNIVQTVITLANRFSLEVVAEGVEDVASLELLKSWGCHWIQGYYIAKPMSAANFKHWLVDEFQEKVLIGTD